MNVRDCGAIGDGTHDDTGAIQLAFDKARQGDRTVVFPWGDYLLTPPIHAPNYVSVYGYAMPTISVRGGKGFAFINEDAEYHGHWSDLYLDFDNDPAQGGIFIRNPYDYVEFSSVHGARCSGTFLSLGAPDCLSQTVNVHDCQINSGPGRTVPLIRITHGQEFTLQNNKIRGADCPVDLFDLSGTTSLLQHNSLTNVPRGFWALKAHNDMFDGYSYQVVSNWIRDNYFENVIHDFAVGIFGAPDADAVWNHVTGSYPAGGGNYNDRVYLEWCNVTEIQTKDGYVEGPGTRNTYGLGVKK